VAETGDDGDDDQLALLCDPEEREKSSIKDRATALRDHPALAATTRPERWPEVIGVAQAYARGSGLPEQRLGEHDSDPGVRAILKLYVAGFTQPRTGARGRIHAETGLVAQQVPRPRVAQRGGRAPQPCRRNGW